MRPKLKVLEFCEEIALQDLACLVKMCAAFGTENPSVVLHWRTEQKAAFWRTKKGLVVTQTVSNGAVKELFVYGIAGRDILPVLEHVASDLKIIAEELDCSIVGGNAYNPLLGSMFEKFGGKPVFTYYQMEL